jgi:phage terminase large subunit
MMKARDAAAARPLPPVQRPGTAASRAELAQSDLRSLSTRLTSSGHLKDAVALYRARKARQS